MDKKQIIRDMILVHRYFAIKPDSPLYATAIDMLATEVEIAFDGAWSKHFVFKGNPGRYNPF